MLLGMKNQRGISLDFWRDRTATSAVELAILSPIFVLFIMGMIAYGIYFGARHSIQQIAADAARTAIAGQNSAERQILVQEFIDQNAAGYPLIHRERLSFNAADSNSDANQFNVSVSYDATDLPIWNLFPDIGLPGRTIVFSSTIRIGGI